MNPVSHIEVSSWKVDHNRLLIQVVNISNNFVVSFCFLFLFFNVCIERNIYKLRFLSICILIMIYNRLEQVDILLWLQLTTQSPLGGDGAQSGYATLQMIR